MWWIIGGIVLTLIYGLAWVLCAMSAQCSRAEEKSDETPLPGE